MYYSPSMNQTTNQVFPLDDTDLATHFLRMCLAKWQIQYDLTEKTTPVNTRAFLLILEKIKNNAEVEAKPTSSRMKWIDSRTPKKSKRVGFSGKQCALCKKHGGPHKLHNTCDCHKYNPDSTLIKRNGGAGSTQRNGQTDKNHSNRRERKGAIFAQIICKEVKKAFRKHSHKCKKHHTNHSESDSNFDYSS
jgi:hypothetical protein